MHRLQGRYGHATTVREAAEEAAVVITLLCIAMKSREFYHCNRNDRDLNSLTNASPSFVSDVEMAHDEVSFTKIETDATVF